MTIQSESPITHSKTFDVDLEMKDAGLVAADGAASVGGSAQTLDIGRGKVNAELIVDVTAIETASADENYDILFQGSNDNFVAQTVTLAKLSLGGVITNIRTAASTVGRYRLPVTNVHDDVTFEDVRLFNDVSGTIATGINYTAFLTKQEG